MSSPSGHRAQTGPGAAGVTDASERPRAGGETVTGELLGRVSEDLPTLVRQEIALAGVEATQSASRADKGAGLLGGAGVAAVLASRGCAALERVGGMPRTTETVEKVPGAFKGQETGATAGTTPTNRTRHEENRR